MSVNQRISELRKDKKLSQEQLANLCGVTKQAISDIERGKSAPGFAIVQGILSSISDLNPAWFILGQGEMYVGTANPSYTIVENPYTPYNTTAVGVPLYGDLLATGGIAELFMDTPEVPTQYISVPGFNDCDGAIPVIGNSMAPRINSGDIVLCKKEAQPYLFLYGEIYLVITRSYRTIKYVRRGTSATTIILASHDSASYEPVEIEVSELLHLYRVRGIINKTS